MNAPTMRRLGAVGIVVVAYLLTFGAALAWSLGASLAEIALCAAPAVLAAVLAMTSQADRRQYVARLFAAFLFLPAGLLMWATSDERAGLWLLVYAALHAAAIVMLVLWLAGYATRIEAPGGVAPVAIEALRRRLASLASGNAAIAVARGDGDDEWVFELRLPQSEGRSHRVVLDIDAGDRSVGVREFVGADGAPPRTEDERSMRGPADPLFDPSRPTAQALWTRTWQATMIEPERLAGMALVLDADRVEPGAAAGRPGDGEALVTLLAAIATRSGYAWQPRLFGRAPRTRSSAGDR